MRNSTTRVMIDGAIGGLLGAAVMIGWLAFIGAVTATSSGFAVFASAYLALHFAAFAAVGAVGGLILNEGKWDTALFLPVGIFVFPLSVLLIAVVMLAGPAEGVALPWWNVIIGDFLATVTIYSFLFERHQRLAEDLRDACRGVIGVRTQVICPETHAAAIIRIDPARGTVQSCSRWPRCYDCPRDCAGRIQRRAA